jgi:MFS transporter, DHA3 family, tetracycline resistance protein
LFSFNPRLVYFLTSGSFNGLRVMSYLVLAVYYVQVVGMNPLQLVLVGTVLELAILVFEVPTGVFADTFSRKWSVVIGIALLGVSFLIQPFFPNFPMILLAQVIAGLGYSFESGALSAWIADEVGEAEAGEMFIRGYQISTVCVLFGTVIGTSLAVVELTLPAIVGGFALIGVGILLIFIMQEKNFKPVPRGEHSTLQAMGHTFKSGISLAKSNSIILTILLIGLIFGAFSEGFDRLYEAHFLASYAFPDWWGLKPVVWFGVMYFVAVLIHLAISEFVRRKIDTTSHAVVARTLLISNSLLIISLIAFGLAVNFGMAVLAYWLSSAFRNLNSPLYTIWLNQNLPSQVRATVLSMGSQADAVGQFLGGPLLGLIATGYSIGAALVTSAFLLVPAIFLYSNTMRKGKTEVEVIMAEAD